MLHTVGYDDGGRTRPILHRAAISEMVVPYGDPGPVHGWKNAFDAGEWGLGPDGQLAHPRAATASARSTTSTPSPPTSRASRRRCANAICIHEEDYGILWKHQDLHAGRTEVRRSRRLVVSSIATVGNYEYGFYWYFYLDGSIQLEVKLTGIMSTQAARRRRAEPPHARAHRARAWRRRSTSTCSAPASTSTSTGPSTRCTRSTSSR